MAEMLSGTVKMFDPNRAFGFIKRDDGDGDLFFHVTGLLVDSSDPLPGDKVTFQIGANPRDNRPCATWVKVVAQ